ncbi:hypothetical protein HGRIS_002033 [Hohenbuehelia grisea]|uniref:Uncharacterized protein n=1 Tax=Hohenbuehelia grisea TaxID=104357 RepID=A0ABR3JJC1_9AGAR
MKFTLFVALLAGVVSVLAAPIAEPASSELVARARINERAVISDRDHVDTLLRKDIKERAELAEDGLITCEEN